MDVLPIKKRLDVIALFAECFEKQVLGELRFFFFLGIAASSRCLKCSSLRNFR